MKKLSQSGLLLVATVSLGLITCTILANAKSEDSTRPVQPAKQTSETEANVSLTLPKDSTVTLHQVPTFTFENVEMKAEGLKDVAVTSNPQPMKVKNPGLENGWHVTASISDFKRQGNPRTVSRPNETAKETLKGATVTLSQGTISGNQASVNPIAPAKVVLNKENGVVFAANAGTGLGQSSHNYDKSNVRISVPEGNRIGAYSAKITWTMNVVPNP